jgi:hypothetical protein
LDIILTKDWRISRKLILFSGFKTAKKENSSLFMEWHLVELNNVGRKTDKDSTLCLETSTKNAVQEFHFRTNAQRWRQ